MNKDKKDHFEILRKIEQNPNSSQRKLAEELGFSLGKLNYCLKALKNKGLVKIENFNKNPNKIKIITFKNYLDFNNENLKKKHIYLRIVKLSTVI